MLRGRSSESRDSTVTRQHTAWHIVGAHSIVFGVNEHEYIVSHFIKKKKKKKEMVTRSYQAVLKAAVRNSGGYGRGPGKDVQF